LDVTLTWDTDIQVEAYKLYYKTGSSGPPYIGTDAAEGDSPVDVGWASEFTLRALSDTHDYYFVVTAYTQDGESGYSNEVTTARSGSVATNSVTTVSTRLLTTEQRMRFIMFFLIPWRRLPDASNNLSAQSLSSLSGCPSNGVHLQKYMMDPISFCLNCCTYILSMIWG
jgi:hypothetical protein